MRNLLLAATMLGALVGTANADAILTLTKVPDQTVGPQNLSNPCIIAGTTCQPHSDDIIGYNNFVNQGGKSDYNLWSTTPTSNSLLDGTKGTPYTVSALEQAVGGSLLVIAIDVDTTHASAENLFFSKSGMRQTRSVLPTSAMAFQPMAPASAASPAMATAGPTGPWAHSI